MNDDNAWVHARSAIVWILALCAAFGAVWKIEQESRRALAARAVPAQEAAAVGAAWSLIERTAASGLPADAATYLSGLAAAREAAVLPPAQFDARVSQLLAQLAQRPPEAAADAARLIVTLELIASRHAQHADAARALAARLGPAALANDGGLK